MQRICVNIDSDNNQLLTEEIDKAIEGAVKARCREVFDITCNKELNRIVEDRFNDILQQKKYYGISKLEKIINKKVDEKIKDTIDNYLKNIQLPSSNEIKQKVESRMNNVEERIDYFIQLNLQRINFENNVSDRITKVVKKELPETLFTLLIGKLKE